MRWWRSSKSELYSGTFYGDSLCKSTNVIYRLDTESARAFLDDFVALP